MLAFVLGESPATQLRTECLPTGAILGGQRAENVFQESKAKQAFCSRLPNVFRPSNAMPQEYAEVVAGQQRHVLLDVRAEVQFSVCSLENAVNVPLARLEVGGPWALSVPSRAYVETQQH